MAHEYEFNVAMSCSGCSGAIERVLKKLEGVESMDISLEKQTVNVRTVDELSYETVYEKIKKTGKEIKSGRTVV